MTAAVVEPAASGPRTRARFAYRPELDGLRALAVAAVLASHAGFPVAGGYGVTVFFVLSGYLITSLLLVEHATTGTISLRAFYRRRIARLAPALLTVIAVTMIVIFACGKRLSEWWLGLAGALTYSTNIVDQLGHGHVSSYFEYTWSLSVEEQFYLLWPALVIFVLSGSRRPRLTLAVTCGAGIAFSWIMRAIMVAQHASVERGKLSFESHVDALAWGALIAVAATGVPRCGRWASAAVAACLAGLALLARFDEVTTRLIAHDVYGFGQAGALAALLVWLCVTYRDNPMNALLGSRPLARIGRLSYGLYLWNILTVHWFQMIVHRAPARAGWHGVLWVVALVLLAEVSYRLIETPLRLRWARPRTTRGGIPSVPSRP